MAPSEPCPLPRLATIAKIAVPPRLADHSQLAEVYHRLADACERIDLIVVSTAAEGHRETVGKLNVIGLPAGRGWRGRLGFLHGAIVAVRELDRTVRPDLYWASDPLDSGWVTWLARRRRAPWVVQVQGDFFHLSPTRFSRWQRALMAWSTAFLSCRATRVRVVSHAAARDLVERGVSPERLAVVPPRIDEAQFDPERWAAEGQRRRADWGWQDACVMLFVGGFNASKGLDLLLAAIASVREEFPALRTVLVGDGPLRGEAEQLVAGAGLTELVRFAGQVPFEELPAWYAASDAAVVSSRDEGLGRNGLQGAAMGLPVIMTDVGGNADVVVPGETGWLVDPSVEGLAGALRELAATSPEARRAMGARGRASLPEVFRFEANCAALARECVTAPLAEAGK